MSVGGTQTKSREAQPDQLGINVLKPKFPQYAVLSNRKESFKTWPKYITLQPEELAEAGFIYGGVGDSVKCYYCGGGLRYWEPGDEPWTEHAKWYPSCPHIALNKGPKFVEEVQAKEKGQVSADSSRINECKPKEPNPMDSLAVAALLDFDVEKTLIEDAVDFMAKKINSRDFSNIKAKDLMEIVFDIEEGKIPMRNSVLKNTEPAEVVHTLKIGKETPVAENIEFIQKETERLKEDRACKICLDSLTCVIFLPCGHMVSCPQCAPALYTCPLCRKDIKGTVKAFFA
ncbi:hypothetical protein CHS0354_006734 [Potamilus streckersoni]|uniref:RING-type domain-containing protein n=1 Tax=Potamilus streckersoni TaxID=2493646 RepID=A0AAE0RQY8_9BIVA|nr:hypothetical protein CHS0354_006734 [Potamilus streckersoni]